MTASTAVRYQVVDAGARRLVTVSPAARPVRPVGPGRVAAVSSCRVARPAPSPLLALKVIAVGLLTCVGVAVSVTQFVAMAEAEPAGGYVAGDPAWAHVSRS